MSRVFTCPPVLIARNQASRQNLVESTKVLDSHMYKNQIGRNIIDSKKTHSTEKKERKEKRKHKKETKGDKSRKHKQQFLESDQLEKSSLTEELEQPQNHLGYLSDGSQNSKKRRKRDISPPAVESPIPIKAASVAGNPLKIRLILKKPKVYVPLLPQEDVVCSTSVTKPLSNQDVITKPEDSLPSASTVAIAETKKIKKHRPSKEDRYNALFDYCTPLSICFVDEDDEWLFGNKTQKMLNPKTAVKIDEVMNMRLGDSSWPRAQFLPEVGIHSLPYTVPF